MRLHICNDNGVTLIDNVFIDRYMAAANGEFVKLYLYLLRCAGSGLDISVSSIADFFEHTEKDVIRALSYWEKLKLLQLRYDENGVVSDIIFPDKGYGGGEGLRGGTGPVDPPDEAAGKKPGSTPQPEDSGTARKQAVTTEAATRAETPEKEAETGSPEEELLPVPPRKTLSPARKKALREEENIRQLLYVGNQYTGRPLTTTEISLILYIYDILKLPEELIEYLLEYYVSRGMPGTRYLEKVAQDWYSRGIRTVEDAKQDSAGHNSIYYEILKNFGIQSRGPAKAEVEYMDRWTKEWDFPMDLIQEACRRTILKTHQPSFPYADSILKSWRELNIRTLKQLEEIPKPSSSGVSAAGSSGGTSSRAGSAPAGSTGTAKQGFRNFPQRDYDYTALEQDLLQAQSESEE